MSKSMHLPDADRLSVLAATILIAYASTRFVDIPSRQFTLQLPGIFLDFELNFRVVVALLVAGLTASGADWLLRGHPAIRGHSTIPHWLLPGLTAWVIGVPLYRLPIGWQWIAGFAIGGALLMLVMLAEYIVVDPQDMRYAAATASLTALSFSLLLVLAISLRSGGERLFLVLPALTLAAGLVCLRTLNLRLRGAWAYLPTLALALVVAQFTAALHYLPVSPISFGLILLGPAYAVTSLIGSLWEGELPRRALIEPAVVLTILWLSALLTA